MPDNHDLEAEEAIIAAIMSENALVWEAMAKIRPEEFYGEKCRVIMEAVYDICENGNGLVDLVSLKSQLSSRGQLKLVGGASGLSSMLDTLPDVANFLSYVAIVKQHAMSRRVVEIGRSLQGGASDPTVAMQKAMSSIVEVLAGSGGNPLIRYEAELEDTKKVWEKGGERAAVETGIPRLDSQMVIMKGHSVVIAGHTGTGKTAFATQVAYRTSKKFPVLFVTLEMSPANVVHRIIQSRTGLSVPVIMNPRYATADNRAMLEDVIDREISERRDNLFMLRPSMVTPQDILAAGRAIQAQRGGIGLVVVDYLQLLHCPERGFSNTERVTWLSRALKLLALQLDAPVFVLSQLRRSPAQENREPQLHDLRESGAIEQDADIVVFTHRPDLEKNEGMFLVRKQRYGAPFRVKTEFDGARARFVEPAYGYDVAMPPERTYHND
jgi:replicative DNA helicase